MSKIISGSWPWLFVLLLIVMGALFGLLQNQWGIKGYLARWVQLPTPADSEFELLGSTWRGALVRTDEDQFLYCGEADDQCTPDLHENNVSPTISQCDFNSPAFSIFASPPNDIQVCLQDVLEAADSTTDSIVVLDVQNQLW